MNAVIEHRGGAVATAQTAAEIRAHVNRIQEVMHAVFKEGVHYGRIPGAGDKPVLYKPGAEVICTTFRIAVEFRVEDAGSSDEIRYRVTAVGRHQTTGIVLGEGVGEASTSEEKYRWRAAVCDEEFDDTDYERRRLKWKKGWDGKPATSVKQVRTEPADLANTVLKMACKRALVAMCLITTAASDCFSQDIEDMPDEIREAVTSGDGEPVKPRGKPATAAPKAKSEGPGGGTGVATEPQVKLLRVKCEKSGLPEESLCEHFEIDALEALPFAKVNDALAWIREAAGG